MNMNQYLGHPEDHKNYKARLMISFIVLSLTVGLMLTHEQHKLRNVQDKFAKTVRVGRKGCNRVKSLFI